MTNKPMSSYSDEELDRFRRTPRIRGNKYWGMDYNGETIWIPYEELKEDHVFNIIKHIKNHSEYYEASTLEELEQLYKMITLSKTTAGRLLYVKV